MPPSSFKGENIVRDMVALTISLFLSTKKKTRSMIEMVVLTTPIIFLLFSSTLLVAQQHRSYKTLPSQPFYEEGTDPVCYPTCNSSSVPSTTLPKEEAQAIASAAWEILHVKVLLGELVDKRAEVCPECVPIKWDTHPNVSQCWSSFWVAHAHGYFGGACALSCPQISQKAYEPVYWRVVISTNNPPEQNRALIAWEVTNLVLMLTQHQEMFDGPLCSEIVKRVLGSK